MSEDDIDGLFDKVAKDAGTSGETMRKNLDHIDETRAGHTVSPSRNAESTAPITTEAHNGIQILHSRASILERSKVTLITPSHMQMWEVEEAANILSPLEFGQWRRNINTTEIETREGGWLVTFHV